MSSRFGFLPEIDALRALAVTMTLGAHFIPKNSSFYVPYLWYGVDLFFVISGFLITSILIKSVTSEKRYPYKAILKNFYIRRVLRLFPIYYLFVLFFFLSKHFLNLHIWKDEYNLYFFTYLQNWYFFKIGEFNNMFSHLWSLGVEEQFYIIWPFIIIFVPVKHLWKVFIGLICCSLIFNSLFFEVKIFRNLTFSNFHTLAGGATLAYFYCIIPGSKFFKWILNKRIVLQLLSLTIFIFLLIYSWNNWLYVLLSEIMLSLTCMLLVLNSAYGWPEHISFITKNKIVNHIGKVSYGIYLFHLPIPALITLFLSKINSHWVLPENTLLSFIILFIITYLIASISYKFIELRFLRLKSRFE